MEQIDRRRFIQRAGLGAGAAGALWVAPSVMGFDAAFAGTSCVVKDTLAWLPTVGAGNMPPGSFSFTAQGGKPAINVTLTRAPIGSPDFDATDFRVSTQNPNNNDSGPVTTMGGIANASWLNLQFETGGVNDGELITFTFPSPGVTNLSFTIYDIDRLNFFLLGRDQYQDSVAISPTPSSAIPNTAGQISNTTTGGPYLGVGTSGFPDFGRVDNTSAAGNLLVTIAGPVTTLAITYTGTLNSTSNQVVGIGDLTWCR